MIPSFIKRGIGGGSPTALVDLDFVNNVYTVNGSPVALAAIIDLTARRSASGVSFLAGQPPVQFLGDILTLLLTGSWTYVCEYLAASDTTGNSAELDVLSIADNPTAFNSSIILTIQGGGSNIFTAFDEDNGVGDTRSWFADTEGNSGVNKSAWTVTNTHSAGDMNGDAVNGNSTDNTPININSFSPALANAQIGEAINVLAGSFIRHVWIYAPLADSELPALTAP